MLQQLWARILVGEVATPGTFSLRTLDLVRNLAIDEAKLIERFAKYAFDDRRLVLGGSPGYDFLTENGISVEDVMTLRDLGMIGEIAADTGEAVIIEHRGGGPGYTGVIVYLTKALIFVHSDASKKLNMPVFGLTRVGRDMYSLIRGLSPEANYIRAVANFAQSRGFALRIGDAIPGGQPGTHAIKNIRDYTG